MTTRTEKRLVTLVNKRQRARERKERAAGQRRSTEALHARHVEITRQLIACELRAEKQNA